MGVKLYVDDIRRCPEGWDLARTNTDAIRILATGMVDAISLDHDIAFEKEGAWFIADETYKPVAYYISLMAKKPDQILFHTANIDQGRRMAEIIGCEFEHWGFGW